MFNKKKTIIFFTKNKVTVERVTLGKKIVRARVFESEWDDSNLHQVLSKAKKYTGNSARALVSEEFAYITHITPEEDLNQQQIFQKASQQIPENLNETSWTYSEVLTHNAQKKESSRVVQFVALSPQFYSTLLKESGQAKITIERIDTVSLSTARVSRNISEPVLIIQTLDNPQLIIAHQGVIMATRVAQVTPDIIEEILLYAQEHLKTHITHILYSGSDANFLNSLKQKGLTTEQKLIDPVISFVIEDSGKKKNELNLTLLLTKQAQIQEPSEEKEELPGEKKSPILAILLLCIILLLLIGAGIFFVMTSQNKPQPSQLASISPTSTAQQVPLPTENDEATSAAQIDRSEYKIVVLNGSGQAGEATKMEDFLTGEGFEVLRTGNSNIFDYPKTQIQYQEFIKEEFKKDIETVVRGTYQLEIDSDVPSEEDADILIIVGQS